MIQHYGYSLGPKSRIVHVGNSFERTVDEAKGALLAAFAGSGDEPQERAHIYRQADGYRFMGYVTHDGRFLDMRVQR